jgi:hypothetical protein
MMFDVVTKTTVIIMFNWRNLGALIVDEAPHEELGRTAITSGSKRATGSVCSTKVRQSTSG